MKTLRLLSYLLVVVLSIGFASCSSDDDNNGNVTKLIKEMVISPNYWGNDEVFEFTYDSQNRLSTMKREGNYNNELENYTYTNNSIILYESVHNRTYKMVLDNEGRIIDDGWDWGAFTYENGYLKTTDNGSTQYSWSNGNIAKVECDYSTYEFEYSNVENKVNVDMNFYEHRDQLPACGILRYKGMSNKNLVSKSIYTEKNGYSSTVATVATFDYTFDDDGYPILIAITIKDNRYDDEFTEVRTITYY